MFAIHYNRHTGKISAWGNVDADHSFYPDHEIVRFDESFPIDPERQKIEGGQVVEKTAAEMAPDIDQVRGAILTALQSSDHFALPDRDDLDPERRDAWLRYRKMLRSLKHLPSAAEMIEAWLIDPDGNDPIAQLRMNK